MLERASRIIAVVDGFKIGKVTLARLADVTDINLVVTDDTADPVEVEQIRPAGAGQAGAPPTASTRPRTESTSGRTRAAAVLRRRQ